METKHEKTMHALHDANRRGMETFLEGVPEDRLRQAVTDFAAQHNARKAEFEAELAEAYEFARDIQEMDRSATQPARETLQEEVEGIEFQGR